MKAAAGTIQRRGRGVLKAIAAPRGMEPILTREYQAIFKSNGKPMVIVDEDATISLANAEFERISGYTKEEIEGNKRWTEFVARDDRKRMKEYHLLRRSDPMLAPRCFEFRFVDRHGKIKNIVLTIGHIPGTTKSMISLQDVTDRRQAEATQRASEERYQTFFENSRDAVYITTRDGAYVDANHAALDLFGYTREEMKKVKARQLYVDPADARRLQDEIEKKGFAQDFEVRLRKKDGTEMDCLFSITALRGDDGSILEYQGIARDMTERKRAEETLRESGESYRKILELAPDGITISRIKDERYLLVNNAFCQHTGYSAEEAVGRTTLELNLFVDRADQERLAKAVRKDRRADGLEIQFRAKDGTILDDLVSARPIRFQGESCLLVVATNVNALKKAQESLRQSEARYRDILANIEDAYYEVDLAGNYTFFNEATCKHHGRTREELMVMNYREHASAETAKRIKSIFTEIYRTGIPVTGVENEVIGKDGSTKLVEISVSLLRNASGEPIGFRGISRDRTEQKKVEVAIRESEEKYRGILGNITEGYFENDLRGNLTFFNDSLPAVYGYTRDELLHMNYRQYIDKENARKVYQAYHKVYTTGKPEKEIQYEIIRKDGTRKYLETSVSLMRDAGGRPVGFRGVARDITERKQAEEALRLSEERYRTIIENIQDAYFEVDLVGRFTFVNDAQCRITGSPRERLIGMSNRQYTDETTAKTLYEVFNGIYRTGEPVSAFAFEYTKKDGTKAYNELSASLIRDAQGKSIGFRGVSRDITERKQAQEALQESEARYRTILDSIGDSYTEIDLSGIMTFINQAGYKFLGWSAEEFVGLNYKDYTSPENAKKIFEIYNKVYRTGEPARLVEYELKAKDGTTKIVESTVDLRRDKAGKPTGFKALSRDITQRRRMEEALRQSEERYRTIIETIQEGYYELDLAGHFTFVNDVVYSNLGYSREELIGTKSRRYQDETNAQKTYQAFDDVYKTGEPIKALTTEYTSKDGTKRTYEISASLIRDAEGKPIGYRGISRDVTERKLAEETLRQSEEKYRTILENIEDGYGELDLRGKLTFFNNSLPKILGYPTDELKHLDMHNRQYMDEETAQKLYQAYNKTYTTGEPEKEIQYEIITKDGTKRNLESSISLKRDAGGQPVGFRGIVRDKTERRKAEEQLKRYAAEMERSNEEVKNFAYIVSHDLRVPLINLKGYTSELRSALEVIGSNFDAALPHLIDEKRSEVAMALHEDVPEALEFITNSVSRMDSFINAILILSRLGRQDLKPEPIDMNALVKTTVETMSHQIQERGIEVIVGSLPQVVADRTAMEQIMGNILSNAVKYPDSSRPCRIEVAAEVNNGETIFSIRDTGRGIAAEDMHKVFAPFRRAGKQDTQGEGMGLAYVQTLVRRHGGRIWCESELGKGTTFALTISSTFKQGAYDA